MSLSFSLNQFLLRWLNFLSFILGLILSESLALLYLLQSVKGRVTTWLLPFTSVNLLTVILILSIFLLSAVSSGVVVSGFSAQFHLDDCEPDRSMLLKVLEGIYYG